MPCLRIYCCLIVFCLIFKPSSANLVDSCLQLFDISIMRDQDISSPIDINFEVWQQEMVFNQYIYEILIPELSQYPIDYFQKIQLKKIVLCKDLKLRKVKRAAVPAPEANTLFLSIENSYSKDYLTHVLHHEIHHISEYALWQNMFYDWKKWTKKNPILFEYGKGGSLAYSDQKSSLNWYEHIHPLQGFVNLYSTLGQEEDRSEIVALLMTNRKNKLLSEFIQSDKFLKRKLHLILKLLAEVSAEKQKFWKKKLKP